MSQSEFDIIRRYFADSGLGFAREGVVAGIGDDASLLTVPPDSQLALSLDVLNEGVHFPVGADAEAIGNRALAVNLSDLAAMAATPLCFTLGLSLPQADANWLAGFSRGLLALAQQFNCPLVGGDLVRGPLAISIQVQGLVSPTRVLRRQGARVGDQVYVSGTLGDAAIALVAMGLPSALGPQFVCVEGMPQQSQHRHFLQAYFQPQPRIGLAQAVAVEATSGIDLSDGLAGDLGHILSASGVGARLYASTLPVSIPAAQSMSPANCELAALFGGDDYELCVTVPPAACATVEAAAHALGVPLTRVGEIVSEPGLQLVTASGVSLPITGSAYQHFG